MMGFVQIKIESNFFGNFQIKEGMKDLMVSPVETSLHRRRKKKRIPIERLWRLLLHIVLKKPQNTLNRHKDGMVWVTVRKLVPLTT